jgi:hypothetical protein
MSDVVTEFTSMMRSALILPVVVAALIAETSEPPAVVAIVGFG